MAAHLVILRQAEALHPVLAHQVVVEAVEVHQQVAAGVADQQVVVAVVQDKLTYI